MVEGIYKKAREDAESLLTYTMEAPIADDKPLRGRIFQKLEEITSNFPGKPSKYLVSTIYLTAFFDRVNKILGGGFDAFWFYINRTREEIAPLIVTYVLITYILAFMGASYMVGIAPELALASAILFPTLLVSVVFTGYMLYLYYNYRKWLSRAREVFLPIVAEWRKKGRITPPPAQPYEL